MTDEKFSPEESIRLIRSMIVSTRHEMSGNAHYFLAWGWIAFIACAGQFVLKHIVGYPKHYQVWYLIILGIAYSVYMGFTRERARRIRTFVGDSMGQLWMGMGISFFVLSMIITRLGWDQTVFPFFILLYGLGTFVSGNILKFKPLIIGGLLAWAIAIVSVYLSYDYQILSAAAALLVSYIIPAHILRWKHN